MFPFLRTAHQDAGDIAIRSEHFILVQKEVDVKTFQTVRQIILALHVLVQLQNEALFELAFSGWEHRRGRPPAPPRRGSSVYFSLKQASLSDSVPSDQQKKF